MITSVVASEQVRAQTVYRNMCGVRTHIKGLISVAEDCWKTARKRVKAP